MPKEGVSRREYLIATGAAGIASLAGCSSGGGSDTSASTSSSGDNSSTPTSATDQIGETRLSSGETRLKVNEAVVTQTLYNIGAYGTNAVSAEDGKQFILIDMQAKKQTENGSIPEIADYRIEAGSVSYSINNIGSENLNQPVNAELYQIETGFEGPEVGSTTRGWLVFKIPADISTGTLQVRGMQTQDDDPVAWKLRFDDEKTITFEEEIDLPDKAKVAGSIEATVSVKNTGGRTGRYTTVVTSELLSDSRTLEYTLSPGETREKTFKLPIDGYYEGNASLSVGSAKTATMDIAAPNIQIGETWTAPSGIEYTVSDLALTRSLNSDILEVGDGKQVAIARFTATNTTTENQMLPERWEEPLAIVTGDQAYTNIENRSVDNLELTSPVSGSSYPRTLLASDPGTEVSGLMLFYLPASISKSDIEIRLSHDEIRAIWSP